LVLAASAIGKAVIRVDVDSTRITAMQRSALFLGFLNSLLNGLFKGILSPAFGGSGYSWVVF
jgi:hypothetical protein